MGSHSHFFDHHVIGVVSTNCYVFGNPKEAIMLDPGGSEAVNIAKHLEEQGIEIKHVLVSHGHFDHLGWAGEVQKQVEGATVYLHQDEKRVYEEFIDWIPRYGLDPVELREPDEWVEDGKILDLSGYKFEVMHTPGHSPGSATFLLKDLPNETYDDIPLQRERSAFVGDCIFQGSIGRVDLPYADKNDMKDSLHRLMDELDPNTHLFPGHGNDTQMGYELEHNPYLKALQNGISIF